MKFLIDIGHPAHVHYFKNFIKIMRNEGHQFLVVARDKDVTFQLLDSLGIDYISRGAGSKGLLRKLIYMIKADIEIFKIAKVFKPNFFISFSSPYAAQVSSVLNIPHIAFTDTEHATLGNLAFAPFSKKILTPNCFKKEFGKKHVRFDSYMELCYLHPKYFCPDIGILDILKVSKNEKYVIIRFVSWEATHDIGHSGITLENKIKAVEEFSKYSKVFISSEGKLPDELDRYKINIPVSNMHDALAFASLFYGESATMASESAVLGTPAIFLDNNGRGYTDEQDMKYGIVFNFSESLADQKASIEKGVEILSLCNNRNFKKIGEDIIRDKVDPTKFLVDYILNY